jgi:CMP-N,N'-diacetyllegionaminic acid synthase
MSIRVLGIIPARGGSKGVPRKNIKMLAGKPLLAYTAEAALAATRLTKVILSTEDS